MSDAPKEPIDLGEVLRKGAEDRFWAIRGHAVQAYASLEQSLCRLFGQLADTPIDAASIIFFRIVSTQARNAILEKLFRRKHGDEYNLFRNSLLKDLRPIDKERNEIIHWNVNNRISTDASGEVTTEVLMHPPTFPYGIVVFDPPTKRTQDIESFIEKCSFYSRLCNMFFMTMSGSPIPEADKDSWLRIFREPVVYPPPTDHPLSLTPQEPDTPPESSPG